jgi:hypothetical protein
MSASAFRASARQTRQPDYPSIESIAKALKGAHKSGGGYMAKCPCHDDSTASLGIVEGRDKRTGVKRPYVTCFAGCDWRLVQSELERLGVWPKFEPRGRS